MHCDVGFSNILIKLVKLKIQELHFIIIANSSRYLLQKTWIWVLWILRFIFAYFSSESVLQGMFKNNTTEKQIDAKIQVTLKHVPARNITVEKVWWNLSQQITKKNYKLQLLASEYLSCTFCHLDCFLWLFVGNKAKEWISKQVFQENKARQIFQKANISYPLICTRTCIKNC